MRRLYFYGTSGHAAVSAAELDHLWRLVITTALTMIRVMPSPSRLRVFSLMRGGRELSSTGSAASWEAFATWFMTAGPCRGFQIGKRRISCEDLALNTFTGSGNVLLALVASICRSTDERWAIIEAEDIGWFSRLVAEGLELEVLRDAQGWEDVIELLAEERGSSAPVVLRSSISPAFPDSDAARWASTVEGDPRDWDDLGEDEQRELAIRGLRGGRTRMIAPDTIDVLTGSGLTVSDLRGEGSVRQPSTCR